MGKEEVKICYVTNTDLSAKFILFNHLKFLKSQGYDVHLVSSKGKWLKDIGGDGINVKIINFKRRVSPFSDCAALLKLYFYFKKEKFQIVHTHTPKPGLLGQMAAKFAGVPVIINTVHGFYFNEDSSFLRKILCVFVEKISARFSSLIFSVSREDVVTALKKGICKADKIKYIGNGVDIFRFDASKFPPEFVLKKKEELGIQPDKKIIGIVGRLVAEKGYLELFAALKKIIQKMPNVLLLCVGPEDLEKKDAISPGVVKKYGVENNVLFLGERSDIEEIYPLMDVFVLPSHREGLPYSVLEAGAMKKPIVAADIRGCREIVKSGKSGLLFPVKDVESLSVALLYLLTNPNKAMQMGEEASRRISTDFDEKIIFSRIEEEYKRLLAAK